MAALAGLVDARPDGESARVLVVDDNVKAVELLATAIEAEGLPRAARLWRRRGDRGGAQRAA